MSRKNTFPDLSPEDYYEIEKNDAAYPGRLQKHAGMPKKLYCAGKLPDDAKKSVAIVGARSCSIYGQKEAVRFASVLASHGVQIISGLAYGIDAAAHKGALDAGGTTFAVLGCGVDICYPRANLGLYRRILLNGGGIISEYEPGEEALSWHFPVRNRIISGLADIVLVVEAKQKSGSLITADYALEQGKTVCAVPGKNSDALSRGCNELIAQGAALALSPEYLLEELGIWAKTEEKKPERRPLPAKWNKEMECVSIYSALNTEGKTREQLQQETGIPVARVSAILIRLCLEDLVTENCGRYCLKLSR